MNTKDKILLLYSGGLDSRLSARILKDKGYDITAVFFHLPFASAKEVQDEFLNSLDIPLIIFDCTKGELLQDYLDVLKNPEFGRGVGYNPCIDCKLFMTNKLTRYAEKYGFNSIATGEVPGQRPMSQTSGKMKIIRERTETKLIRPVAELGIEGRSRKKQIKLAKQYNIEFPSPGGGCLLCEKGLKKRFEVLIENNFIDDNTLPLSKIGRHFYFHDTKEWFVVGRNKEENDVIEKFKNVIVSGKGKPAVHFQSIVKQKEESAEKALEFQKAYELKDKEKIKHLSHWKI